MIIEKQLENYLLSNNISFETEVSLKKKTWIHRGGIAGVFVKPNDVYELQIVVSYLYKFQICFLLVGCTSNIYIRNTTNIPVVVSTLNCNHFKLYDGYILCDCGVLVSRLAKQMISSGIRGFEYLTKLPGTVGAAIYNNSSVKEQSNSITNLLEEFDLLTPDGLKTLKKDDLHLDFRSSDLKKHITKGVILRCRMRAEHGDKLLFEKIANENEQYREKILEGPSQNLGCTVNRMFCNGRMERRYEILYRVYSKVLSFFVNDDLLKKKQKRFLLTITGFRELIPYVSDKQLITFIWRDDGADQYFDDYLRFMKTVCKTDKVEIEVL